MMEELKKPRHYLRQAHEKALQNRDWFNYWQSSNFLGGVYTALAQFEDAYKFYKICLELSNTANNIHGISQANAFMGMPLAFQGRIPMAYRHTLEALRASESCPDAHTRATAHTLHGFVCFFRGEFTEAVRFLAEAIKLTRKSAHDLWKGWAEFWLAHNFYHSGKYKEARHFFRETLTTFKNRKDNPVPWESFHELCLQMAQAVSGEAVRDFCPSFFGSQKVSPQIAGIYQATLARILIMFGPDRWSEAESLLNNAIATDDRIGTRWSLAQDHAALSELHQKNGDRTSARHHLNQAIEIMQECGADGWVEKYQAALSEIK
jgi:tetratricopeptide (TPR) repeat protein